jgi:dTDP-4-dehydrorhamnose 3,5-epimerase
MPASGFEPDMEFIETSLSGAFVVRPKRIADERGYFARVWCREELARRGLNGAMVQMNTALTLRRGTVRGLHFQLPPHAEAKFIRCTHGAIFDVIVDLRPGSPTQGRWFGLELSAAEGTMLYAPEGFAHGYQTLTDGAEMSYLTSAAYAPAAARGVRPDDPALAIRWPLPVGLVSETDRRWPDYHPQLWPADLKGGGSHA